MTKHISQKGAFHIVPYLSSSNNDKSGRACGYYKKGMCLKDNCKCMDDSYCNYRDPHVLIKENKNFEKSFYRIYTLLMVEDGYRETVEYYISDNEKNINAFRISEGTALAQELITKEIGDVFIINKTEYTLKSIKNIEE